MLLRLEDKAFEKQFIEALCFYVKRQLQQRNMDKYRQIAKQTQQMQFQQNLLGLPIRQTGEFFGFPPMPPSKE